MSKTKKNPRNVRKRKKSLKNIRRCIFNHLKTLADTKRRQNTSKNTKKRQLTLADENLIN
jgi:hypothetical protein